MYDPDEPVFGRKDRGEASVVAAMRWEGTHTHPVRRPARFDVPDLHLCRGCGRPFVVPSAVLDVIAHDRYLMEMQCNNCDLIVVEAHGEDVLEALDQELDRQRTDMEVSLELFTLQCQREEIEAFAYALEQDAILPEDF